MIVAETRAELREALGTASVPDASGPDREHPTALVATMGALHEGHLHLFGTAASLARTLVVSIFVNPLQFGPGEDLTRYPRPRKADLDICRESGVDVVFAPEVPAIYPVGEPLVTIDPGPLGGILEGASRSGHFRGMLTVVSKLFGLVRPDVSVFGEKDYQQLVLVGRMVDELCLGVHVVGAETIRDADGLALSSRNRYLSEPERRTALTLSRALQAGRGAGSAGPAAALEAAEGVLSSEPGLAVDYLTVTAADLSRPPERGNGRILVAAWVGATRLVDNVAVELGAANASSPHAAFWAS